MSSFFVLYGPPADPVAFENHYLAQHLPLLEGLPRLASAEYAIGLREPDGSPGGYYAFFRADFVDEEARASALASQQGQDLAADMSQFASGGAVVLLGNLEPAI